MSAAEGSRPQFRRTRRASRSRSPIRATTTTTSNDSPAKTATPPKLRRRSPVTTRKSPPELTRRARSMPMATAEATTETKRSWRDLFPRKAEECTTCACGQIPVNRDYDCRDCDGSGFENIGQDQLKICECDAYSQCTRPEAAKCPWCDFHTRFAELTTTDEQDCFKATIGAAQAKSRRAS